MHKKNKHHTWPDASRRTWLKLRLLLMMVLFALAASARADLTDQQVKDYVRNTWEITDLSDEVLSETLDTSYSGIPFKSWIKFFIRAPSIANPLLEGDYRKAANEAQKYAADQSISYLLAQAGLTGVSAVAELATWPIDHAIQNFQQTVAQNSFKKQLDLYFQARKFNSYEAIRDLAPADILEAEGNPVSKDDSGWLFRSLSYLYGSVPGYTPAEFFAHAETVWQAYQAADLLGGEERNIAGQFRRTATAQAPSIVTDLTDLQTTEGQTATFSVVAQGSAPLTYRWYVNGQLYTGNAATFTLDVPGTYQVQVSNDFGTVASRVAKLTVTPTAGVSLTAPSSGAVLRNLAVVKANAPGATKVEFYLDGVRQATDAASPFAWSWDTTMSAEGAHQLLAKAYNGATLLGTTPTRTVSVDNVTAVPGEDADAYEPNNSSAQATTLTFGASVQARVSTPSDADWFKVTTTTPGILTFNLNVPPGKDYDIELFGPNAAYISGSYGNTGAAESITHNATATGTYWVRVYGYPVGNGSFSITNAYTLIASFTNGVVNVSTPQNQSVPWGASATFSVVASNSTNLPMTYQWQRNGVDIPGATAANYTTPPTSLSGNGDQFAVRVNSTFGSVTSATATLTVSNPASIYWTGAVSNDWNTSGNWDLGHVPNGAEVVRISGGSVSLSSGAAYGYVVLSTGTMNWTGGELRGALTVAGGAVLNITGSGQKYIWQGGSISNFGTVNWSGAGTILTGSDVGGGSVIVSNGAGALFNILGDAGLYYQYNQVATFSNAGTVRKSGGSGTTTFSCPFANTGTVDVQSGTLAFQSYAVTQASGATVLSGGTLSLSQALELAGGNLSGSGTINGSVNNTGGAVEPGNGVGTMTVNGTYTQSANGTLVIEITGSNPGTEYDRFFVTGLATLGGTVEAQLMNGYQPALGQTFIPMTFGSRSGMFSFLDAPDYGDDLTFETALTATTLSLNVVRTAFGEWKQTKFGANASNPAIAGPMADPNHNGTPNLLEFAFGMEPLIASQTEKLPVATQVTASAEEYLAVRFHRLTGAAPGVSYTVLESTNLSTWLPVNMQTCQVGTPVDNGDGTETVTVRSTMPIHGAASPGRAFLRVQVAAD